MIKARSPLIMPANTIFEFAKELQHMLYIHPQVFRLKSSSGGIQGHTGLHHLQIR